MKRFKIIKRHGKFVVVCYQGLDRNSQPMYSHVRYSDIHKTCVFNTRTEAQSEMLKLYKSNPVSAE